jgi:hypothetical protein
VSGVSMPRTWRKRSTIKGGTPTIDAAIVEVTARGRAAIESIAQAVSAVGRELFANLDPAGVALLRDLLSRVRADIRKACAAAEQPDPSAGTRSASLALLERCVCRCVCGTTGVDFEYSVSYPYRVTPDLVFHLWWPLSPSRPA